MYETTFTHLTPSLIQATGESNTDFKFSQTYINETSSDITVTLRNNLPITVGKALGHNRDRKTFIVRNNYLFKSNEQIVNTINNINEYERVYGNKEDELVLLKKVLLINYNNDRFCSNVSVTVEYNISLSVIKENGSVYIPETDTLLVHGLYNALYPHPFSSEGHALNEYSELIKEKKVSGMFIELIDNENNIKSRYMYVAKKLVEIPVRKDPNKSSGVYFSRSSYDRLNEVHIHPEFYTHEEAELELGLYKTKEEASTGGNPENINKQDLVRKEQELIEAKHNLNLTDIKNRETINNLELELEKIRKENTRIKEDLDKKKAVRSDYFEERSVVRKDNQEIIKYLPAVFTGVITALAIYNTVKKK